MNPIDIDYLEEVAEIIAEKLVEDLGDKDCALYVLAASVQRVLGTMPLRERMGAVDTIFNTALARNTEDLEEQDPTESDPNLQ